LPNPYKAKNRDFDTVEELILVKGVTPAMLYGDGKRKGIINYLTVFSSTTTINVNSAPKEVLMAIPGITPEQTDYIVKQRAATAIQGIQELAPILGGSFPLVSPYLSASESNTFSISTTGDREGGQHGYGIRAIVTFDGSSTGGYRYLYYKSPAQVQP